MLFGAAECQFLLKVTRSVVVGPFFADSVGGRCAELRKGYNWQAWAREFSVAFAARFECSGLGV